MYPKFTLLLSLICSINTCCTSLARENMSLPIGALRYRKTFPHRISVLEWTGHCSFMWFEIESPRKWTRGPLSGRLLHIMWGLHSSPIHFTARCTHTVQSCTLYAVFAVEVWGWSDWQTLSYIAVWIFWIRIDSLSLIKILPKSPSYGGLYISKLMGYNICNQI